MLFYELEFFNKEEVEVLNHNLLMARLRKLYHFP